MHVKKNEKLDYYELWVRPQYSKSGIWELVRIVYSYSKKSALEFILPEFRHQIQVIKYKKNSRW